MARPHHSKAGQSLIESCIIIMLMGIVFFGIIQLSQAFAAREFLHYAASRGTRARTVGLNQFMVWKVVRVGSIPNAGKMLAPEYARGPSSWRTDTPQRLWQAWRRGLTQSATSPQWAVEEASIPLYLGGEYHNRLNAILDYEDWDTVSIRGPVESSWGRLVSVEAAQQFPLRFPFHRAFYADDVINMSGESEIENHYPLYLFGNR